MGSSGYNAKAIIREYSRAYSVFDDGANNFYLDDLDYYIYNSYDSSGLERAVTENFWDGNDPEDNIENFYPDDLSDWDFTDWSDTPYEIGDAPDSGGEGGDPDGGGGGDNLESNTLLAAIRFEHEGRYNEAATTYRAFIDTTSRVREKQIAMRRLLDASVSGNLDLVPLLSYYQTIKLSSRNVHVSYTAAKPICLCRREEAPAAPG